MLPGNPAGILYSGIFWLRNREQLRLDILVYQGQYLIWHLMTAFVAIGSLNQVIAKSQEIPTSIIQFKIT